MTAWDYINAPMCLAVVILITYELLVFGDRLILLERLGMGLYAAGMFLNIARIIAAKYNTPFEGWSSTLSIVGIMLYISGRLVRHAKHTRANNEQRRIADEYLRGRQRL